MRDLCDEQKKNPEPLNMSKMCHQPWSTVSLDFQNLPNGNELLLAKDESSKQVVYDEVKLTSAIIV